MHRCRSELWRSQGYPLELSTDQLKYVRKLLKTRGKNHVKGLKIKRNSTSFHQLECKNLIIVQRRIFALIVGKINPKLHCSDPGY